MDDGVSKRNKRKQRKKRGGLHVQECLNPTGETVVMQHTNIGCTTIYEAEPQPSSSRTHNPRVLVEDVTKLTMECEDESAAIRNSLKTFYQNITLPSLPWMEDVDIPIEYFTKLQLKTGNEISESKIIELHTLFETVNGKKPRRILIESQPGFGKTTLTHKITSDWVNEESYVKRFKFAFLIILRDYKSCAVKDVMMEIISDEYHTEDKIWRIINSEETLLIFDGLDEVSENVKNDILEIVYDTKDKYKMTIVITSRYGHARLKKQQVESKFRGVSAKIESWCKKITILGINTEDRDKFLDNFVDDDENKDTVIARLLKIITPKEEMFKSPLLLILLVYVTREDHDIKIENNTGLYKQFADYIIRRSISKANPATAKINFTLFDSSVNEYSSMFYKFGKVCWEHILNDQLQFKSNADTEAIHRIGFLMKHETKKKLGTLVHYEGFHLSILEFAAAVFLKKEFQDNHNRFCDSLIKKIVEICAKRSSSLVIPFLCGLLGNDVAPFFDQLSHCHVKYWIEVELTESILQECEMNELISEYFGKIVPSYVRVDDDSPSALLKMVNQYYLRNVVDILEIDLIYLLKITQPLRVRVLICNCNYHDDVTDKDFLDFGENITCESLTFYASHLDHETFISALELFEKISYRDKNFHLGLITEGTTSCLETSGYKEMLRGVQFDLFASMYNDVEVIKKIIECNTVTNIYLDPVDPVADDFFRSLINIDTLHTLCIDTDDRLYLNFDAIAESTEKKWELLLFNGIKLECKAQINCNRHVKSLSINAGDCDSSLVHDANVMLSVVPTALRCKPRALELLNNDPNAYFWAGWDEIVELTLSMADPISEEYARGFNNFSRFKNLKILTIEILNKHVDKLDLTDIIKSIGFLTLDRLEIRWRNMHYFEEIIRGIQNLIRENRNFHALVLTTVWVNENKYSDSRLNLELIKSVLQCDDRISFTFYFDGWSILFTFVRRFIHDLLYFNVEYAFIERDYALISSLRSYSIFGLEFRNFHKLELTLR